MGIVLDKLTERASKITDQVRADEAVMNRAEMHIKINTADLTQKPRSQHETPTVTNSGVLPIEQQAADANLNRAQISQDAGEILRQSNERRQQKGWPTVDDQK